MRRQRITVGVVAGLLVLFVLLGGWGPQVVSSLTYAVETGKAKAAEEKLQTATLEHAFELAAEAIQPSVVSISSVKTVKGVEFPRFRRFERIFPFEEFGDDDPFERFFNRRGQSSPGFRQEGLGSGVIVDGEKGYVLTNNHVVDEADELKVRLSDGRSVDAKVIGTDPKTDLAVVKVEASGLHAAKLGNSDNVKVGQWVMAVGSPFGLDQTVTSGIISAKGRANVGVAEYEDFLQTDAAINRGNSGGPLINLKGEVVGINTAILSPSGGNNGIGLAIPINMARQVMDRLITDGKVVRGWLGLAIQELTPELASSFGLEKSEGIVIADVVKGSPAEKAGLRPEDVVVRMDGEGVGEVRAFRNRVAQLKPGQKVKLELVRDGKERTIEVEIGELRGTGTSALEVDAGGDEVGMRLEDLSRPYRRQLGLADEVEGAVVTEVEPGSLADRAGIRQGDVIIEVQGEEVRGASEARRAMAKQDVKKGIRLRVQRGEVVRFVFLKGR